MQEFVIGFAVVLLLFLFCSALVIFAPKSQNFFKKLCPVLENIKKDTLRECFVKLGIEITDDNIAEEYNEFYEKITPHDLEWKKWPENNVVNGDVEYLDVYLFDKLDQINYSEFNKLFDEIDREIEIKSMFFMKLGPNSGLKKHKGWAPLTNETLRFIYCFNSFCYNEDECGIWVNGESKKLFKDYNYIFDASKEHSIYNNTYDDVIFLIIDFMRPPNIANGYSSNDFITT